MIKEYLEQLMDLFQTGGLVMWPLSFCLLLMWFCLGYRFFALRRGSQKDIYILIDLYQQNKRKFSNGLIDKATKDCVEITKQSNEYLEDFIHDCLFQVRSQLKVFSKTVNSIVVAAPLLGLLGTVTGMIELFDSLGDSALFSQTGGIAGGISEALITTQMGLCIAIPGVLMQRILMRKEDNLAHELDTLQVAICVKHQ